MEKLAQEPGASLSGHETHKDQWITRRRATFLVITAGLTLTAVALSGEEPAPTVAQAKQFIQQSGDKLIAILDTPGDWRQKRSPLLAFVRDVVDIDGVAHFALGRFWHVASAEQRAEFVRLFPTILLANIGNTVGATQGMKFRIDRGLLIDERVHVWTTVYQPEQPLRKIVWIIGMIGSAARVVDIVAEGTSMRITQRDDCANYLAHNNYSIAALITDWQRRVTQPE